MQESGQKLQRVALIGFGEAGAIIGADLVEQGCSVTAYDVLVGSPDSLALMHAKARAARVELCLSLADATAGAELIVSAVTATAACDVANVAARVISHGQYFMDINSISPDAKRANAKVIDAAGGRYVDAAVMAPVPPQRLRVPILLGGQHADQLAGQLKQLGMNARRVSNDVGVASAIKMCRSIMIKGLEALTLECLFTARRYGVDDAVLASLHASFPSLGFDAAFPDYLISRIAEHGRRRAAEMREVVVTAKDVGVEPLMANATALRQDALVDAMQAAAHPYDSSKSFSWRELADAIASHH